MESQKEIHWRYVSVLEEGGVSNEEKDGERRPNRTNGQNCLEISDFDAKTYFYWTFRLQIDHRVLMCFG